MNTLRLLVAMVLIAVAGCGGGDASAPQGIADGLGGTSGKPAIPGPSAGAAFSDAVAIGYAHVEKHVDGLEQGRAFLVAAVYPNDALSPLLQFYSIVMDRITRKPLGIITGTMAYSYDGSAVSRFNQLQDFNLWTASTGGFQPIHYEDASSMRLITAGPGNGVLELSATFPMSQSTGSVEFGGRLPQLTYEPGLLPYPDGVGNPPGAIYAFGQSASLPEGLAGPWRGTDTVDTMDMRFDTGGFFSVVDSSGCRSEGTATPASSGHNLFVVRLVDCFETHKHGFAVVMDIDGDSNLFLSAAPGLDDSPRVFAFRGIRCDTCSNTLSSVRRGGRAATQ